HGRGIVTRRDQFLNDPRLKDLREEYRGVLRSVWKNRGYYGVLDLMSPFNRIDWDAIYGVLGIDPQAGRGQLRRAVKAYAGSPEYAVFMKSVRDSSGDVFREARMGVITEKNLDWLDDTLAPSLDGDGNPAFDPELRADARKFVERSYYGSRPALFQRKYLKAFSAALAGLDPASATVGEVGRIHLRTMEDLMGPGPVRSPRPIMDVQAEALADAPLPTPLKRELLRAVFLEGYGEATRTNGLTYESAGDWLSDRARSPAILRALVRQGVVRDAQELLATLLAREDFQRRARKDGFAGYASAASALKAELLAGLESSLSRAPTDAAKAAALADFLATAVDPADGDYAAPETVNTPELRELKERAAALSAPLDLTFAQSLAIFRSLTGSGATPATDAFFRRRLEPRFDDDAAAAADLSLPEILESGRISSGELQLSLAKRVLGPEVARLEASAPTPAELSRLIETLNAYVRHGSLHKDEFLESLAWRLNISGRDLDAFIEDEKSYNWRKANPVLLRFGSGLSAEIGRLSRRGREEFVRYLIQPEGGALPDPILTEIQRNAYETALRINAAKDYPSSPARVREESDRAAELIKLQIEAALIDASPFERIPLYELLLSAGPEALQNGPGYPEDVMRTFLGYGEGSTEEKMLAAFLAVVPDHERTVTMAYMLSQAGDNKSSVKNIFEVFQTVGVKFGQMSSTWKLFGDEIARQTASLKNDARPMTKAEVMEAARRELTPEEFARIKRPVKVVGSASIKTVVLVELQDGREVVMLLRRPHAAEQIESNLRLSSAFLKELDRRGLGGTSALFETVLDAVREQLAGELSLKREADSLRAAKRHYDRLNGSMRAELGPWRFRVPQPVAGFAERDSILFVEKAQGETYDRLAPGVRSAVGPLIADSSLKLLFRDGWFDADRHTGNQLVDAAARVIYPFDFGQAAEFSRTAFWRSDDRYELAQFLRALSDGDADGVLRRGLAMSNRDPRDLDALRGRIRLILAGNGETRDKIVALVGAFADEEAPLDGRFTFGAFKGLMTLAGEDYLPDAAFREALGREIASLLRRKLPRTLSDERR
ncbi:MAG TPA: AarF/UbiB family protein, partial [Elusimicrobiota bacterium]|nr:AarF/UbiB family protein [Elusimicrobiota bacterium]